MFNRNSRMSNRGPHMLRPMRQRMGYGSSVIECVCPICGYRVTHERGVPCHSLRCPKCHVALVPDDLTSDNYQSGKSSYNENDINSNAENLHKEKRVLVDNEKCIGCGKCVDICPQKAIHLENNIAMVDHDKCKKCGKCIKVCTAHAIHFA